MICGNNRVNGCTTIVSERGNILCEPCKNALKTRKDNISEEVKLRLRDFEIQIFELGRKNSLLEKENFDLKNTSNFLENNPESIKNLKVQIDHLQGELEGKNLKIFSLERENERALEGKSYFEADNSGLKSKISLLERELQKKTIKTTTMEGKVLSLEKELNLNRKSLDKETERVESLEKKLNEKEGELTKIEYRLSSSETALETEKKYFHSELDSIQNAKNVLESTLIYLRKENELLKDSISSEKSSSAENSSYEEKYRKLFQEHLELKSWMEKETETFVSSLRKKQEDLETILKEKSKFEKIYNQLQLDFEKLTLDLQKKSSGEDGRSVSEQKPPSLAEQIELEKKMEIPKEPIQLKSIPEPLPRKKPIEKKTKVPIPKPKPLSRVASVPVKTMKRVI